MAGAGGGGGSTSAGMSEGPKAARKCAPAMARSCGWAAGIEMEADGGGVAGEEAERWSSKVAARRRRRDIW